MDVFYFGNAFCNQTGNDQGCTCPQIVGADSGAVKLLLSGNNGSFTLDLDGSAHTFQFGAIAEETGFVNTFRQTADTAGPGHTNADLRLHVCGETGIRTGFNCSMPQPTGGLDKGEDTDLDTRNNDDATATTDPEDGAVG